MEIIYKIWTWMIIIFYDLLFVCPVILSLGIIESKVWVTVGLYTKSASRRQGMFLMRIHCNDYEDFSSKKLDRCSLLVSVHVMVCYLGQTLLLANSHISANILPWINALLVTLTHLDIFCHRSFQTRLTFTMASPFLYVREIFLGFFCIPWKWMWFMKD